MVDYSHNICATVSLAIVSCHADQQCTSSHSQLARTVENFLLSAPNMTPPGTMTASQPEGSFLLGTNLIPPCSVTIVWSIFSNRFYHCVLVWNQEQWQQPALFWGCLAHLWPTTSGEVNFKVLCLCCRNRIEIRAIHWYKIFFNHIFSKLLIHRVFKELKTLP